MERILQVGMDWKLGGIEIFIMSLYRNIDRNKYQFDFICDARKKVCFEEEIKELGGRIFYITPRSTNFLKHIKETKKIIMENNYKVVHWHANTLNNNIPVMLALKNKDTKVIIHSHSCWKGKNFKILFLHYFHSFLLPKKRIIKVACSNEAGKWMFNTAEFKLIRNGVNISKFTFSDENRKNIRNYLNIQDDTVVCGNVGGFNEAKNHVFLIEIFNQYLKINPNCILILIGSGRLEEGIKKKVKSLNLQEKVLFLGECKNVNVYYSAFDAFIFPSLYEGLGIALIEAQISGVKCFVSDAIPEDAIITDKVERISLSSDTKIWAKKIYEGLSEENKRIIENKNRIDLYDEKKLALEVQKLYDDLTKEKGER